MLQYYNNTKHNYDNEANAITAYMKMTCGGCTTTRIYNTVI